jgi:hypothetical protein
MQGVFPKKIFPKTVFAEKKKSFKIPLKKPLTQEQNP